MAASTIPSQAQDDEHAAAEAAGVQITFVPPPVEGTLSLGIYDKAGKLCARCTVKRRSRRFTVR
jgi:hypothetical protein